jgi:hypothetical protein
MSTPYDRKKKNRTIEPDQMSDEVIWDLLSVYADGEATPDEIAQVETLLHRQPSLSSELSFMRHTAEAARTIVEVEPPSHLRSAIFAATIQRPTLARRVSMAIERWQTAFAPRTTRFALAGGACMAAGLAALLLLPHRQHQGQGMRLEGNHERMVAVNHPSAAPIVPETFGTSGHVTPPSHPVEDAVKTKQQSQVLVQTGSQHDVTPGDKMAMQVALNVDRMVFTGLLKPNAVPAAPHIKMPGALRQQRLAAAKTQKPVNIERVPSNDTSGEFSPLPKMDIPAQHALTMAVNKSTDDTLGTNIDGSHDAAPEQPASAVNNTPASGKGHILTVSLSQLPPAARQFQTIAELRREMNAHNLGMTQQQLNAVERKQASYALFSSRF